LQTGLALEEKKRKKTYPLTIKKKNQIIFFKVSLQLDKNSASHPDNLLPVTLNHMVSKNLGDKENKAKDY
jgi:hypothetical protein